MQAKEKRIDRALKKHGFGGTDDPTLMKQLAFLVRDHEHFRRILVTVAPEKRHDAYEALRSEIKRFVPKPLDVYLAESADLAARKEQGSEYAVQSDLDLLAQDAIRKQQAIAEKKGLLKLTCRMCPRSESFTGKTPDDAYSAARIDGWRRVTERVQEYFLCPQCSLASRA